MIRIFLLLLCSVYLHANKVLEIPTGSVNLTSDNYLYYIKEDDLHNTPEKILQSTDLKLTNTSYFGVKQGPYWTKLIIQNNEDAKDLLIYSPHPGANTIDTYIYKNNELIQHHLLGDLQPQSNREIINRFSLFLLKIKPNEQLTIVAKVENYGMYRLGWVINDYQNFVKNEHNVDYLYGLLGGFAIFYFFYTLQLYIGSKKLGYLMINLDVLFITLYMYAVYGILYQLDMGLPLGLITFLAFMAVYIATIARIMFVYFFFDLHKNHRKTSWIILSFALITFVLMCNILYAFYIDLSTIVYLKYHFYFYLTYPLIILGISIYLWRKKENGAGYFIVTEIFHVSLSTLNVLTIFGYINYSWYTPYLLNFAMLIDAVILLYLQFYRNKKEQEEMLKQKQLLLEQSRFFSIGQSLGNITHQWKEPLTHLGSTITMLEAFTKNDQINIKDNLQKTLPNMQSMIKYMRNTLLEFDQFYTTKPQKEYYSPYAVLSEQILPLIETKRVLKNAKVELLIPSDLKIYGYDYQFSNIILVLINNALDEFKADSNDNSIQIQISKENSLVTIVCKDNAGGIKIEPIEKVFDYFVSSKANSNNGHGIGLAMAKVLIEEQLYGNISVKNIENGACFTIEFSDKI